jgi:glycosyltransferase involved in cell wall biosynthesis
MFYDENDHKSQEIFLNSEIQIEKLKRKNINYRVIIFIILVILWNVCFYTNVDKTKNMSRTTALRRGKDFMDKCFNGILMNNNTLYSPSKPKISAVIPIYNCEKTIKAAVRSIQNQNMADIEIILVNDRSTDSSLQIIQELSEEDPRIKIFNNEKNMGTLYTRSFGILKSQGKYIMNLDNDDLFIDVDVFDAVYEEAEKGDYDIVGFGAVDGPTYDPLLPQMVDDFFHHHKDGLIIHQPELTYFPISKNKKFRANDYHVWGRLVKTDLYQKAVKNFGFNAIGEERMSCFLTWNEDAAMSVTLFSFAKSYKFIQKYGIFHYLARTTASVVAKGELRFYGELFFLDVIFDFTDNSFNGKKFAIGKAKDVNNDKSYSLKNKRNHEFLKAIIKKMLNCKFISDEDKNQLKIMFNDLDLN